MCTRKAPPPPKQPTPPEAEKVLPPVPQMANVVAPTMTQAAPARPMDQAMFAPGVSSTARAGENVLIKRRGKRALTIQLGAAPGTNIPGA